MAITPQQYYKIGENKLIGRIKETFNQDLVLQNNPEMRTLLESISTLLYNASREQAFQMQQFIEDAKTYSLLTRTPKLPAGLAKGKITFNADTVGILIDETNTLQAENNILYDPLDEYESIAVSISIVNIQSDGLGTITVETGEDIETVATGNLANIVGVVDSDFDATDVVVTITGLRTFTYSKNIVAKTSTGGNLQATTITIEVESQTFGDVGNLSNGSVANILQGITGLAVDGYVNFTNITGGVDAETEEAWATRIYTKLSQDITTNNDANMRNKALEYPGTTRAWVETSQLTAIINVWHMRDLSTPQFPTTQDNANLLNHLIDTGAISAGILHSNVVVQAPQELSYTVEYTVLYSYLNNNEYKDIIEQSLEKLFENLELNQRATISSIKATITSETIAFYPKILQSNIELDDLIDGLVITYNTSITGVIISTIGSIIYP